MAIVSVSYVMFTFFCVLLTPIAILQLSNFHTEYAYKPPGSGIQTDILSPEDCFR